MNGGFVAIDAGTVNNSGLIILKAPQADGDSRLDFAVGPTGGTVTLNGAGMIVLDGGNVQEHLRQGVEREGGVKVRHAVRFFQDVRKAGYPEILSGFSN